MLKEWEELHGPMESDFTEPEGQLVPRHSNGSNGPNGSKGAGPPRVVIVELDGESVAYPASRVSGFTRPPPYKPDAHLSPAPYKSDAPPPGVPPVARGAPAGSVARPHLAWDRRQAHR